MAEGANGEPRFHDLISILAPFAKATDHFVRNNGDQVYSEAQVHNLSSILASFATDHFVRNNGDQVKVDSLKGKNVGLYFSAPFCFRSMDFTPRLVEVYNELLPKDEFEVVFINISSDSECFDECFARMPWLAVPFSDSKAYYEPRSRLYELFNVREMPCLVTIDENGKVLTYNGVKGVQEYGAEGYPFTSERLKNIKDQEEEFKRNPSLRYILVSPERDYVTSDGKKGRLKEKKHDFEIVIIPEDPVDEESFNLGFKDMPWYALPFKDKKCKKLRGYFGISGIFNLPVLVIIGPDGKTLHPNVEEAIEYYGAEAFPFTPERFTELDEMDKEKEETQTLESILTLGELDYVIGKSGAKIPVSDLVGKNIFLYFASNRCCWCFHIRLILIEAYNKIKGKDNAFEVIFISRDRDQTSFDEFFKYMPWLAIPFNDERKQSLIRTFKARNIPVVVAIGTNGKTITTEVRDHLMRYRFSEAYPFNEERLKELEAKYKKMTKRWPAKIQHPLHRRHYLSFSRKLDYVCDECDKKGEIWAYKCEEEYCSFHVHPKCALKKRKVSQRR